MSTLWYQKTAKEIRDAVHKGEAKALDIVNSFIAHREASDESIGAFTQCWDDDAREMARQVDKKREAGETLGALAGVPISFKESFCTRLGKTTGASRILENFQSPYDGTAVKRLAEADAVFLGKVNMDELAMGSSTETSVLQRTANPWDHSRVPGGSSGGSAASVAAGTSALSLGSDTGSSIRQPASFCGCLGVKPTYGRVSRFGVIGLAPSLDQAGPLTRTVEDAALALNLLCGEDPADSTTSDKAVPDFLQGLSQEIQGLKVGVVKEYMSDDVDEEVRQRITEALDCLQKLGAELVEISLPSTAYDGAVYTVISTAEISATLARLDGVRYGQRHPEARSVQDMYTMSKSAGFGPEVQRRILLGTHFLSGKNRENYFVKAQRARNLIIQEFAAAFAQCDVIAGPTTPSAAFPFGSKTDDPVAMYQCDRFTLGANLATHPALSLPCGKTEGGLPVGLHLQAGPYNEETLLRVAWHYEQNRGFDLGFPPIS